jgi:RsmE family RNA methyltransferase
MNLVLLDPAEVDAQGLAVLRDRRALHIRSVLRSEADDTIRVGVVNGASGTARVEEVTSECVALRCDLAQPPPPRPPASLLLALPRPKVMRRLWAQLAAIGVDRIAIVNAARVERNYFDTHVLAPEFRRALLVEGLQQAEATQLPEVSIHRQLKVFVEDLLDPLFPAASRLVADPGAPGGIRRAIRTGRPERVLLAVGPEGGWTPYEIDLLSRHGFTPVSAGPRKLRSDTACIALLALVHDALSG